MGKCKVALTHNSPPDVDPQLSLSHAVGDERALWPRSGDQAWQAFPSLLVTSHDPRVHDPRDGSRNSPVTWGWGSSSTRSRRRRHAGLTLTWQRSENPGLPHSVNPKLKLYLKPSSSTEYGLYGLYNLEYRRLRCLGVECRVLSGEARSPPDFDCRLLARDCVGYPREPPGFLGFVFFSFFSSGDWFSWGLCR